MVVPDFDWHQMPASQQMGHAIVLAGYEDTPHGTYFLIHNSWGPEVGHEGLCLDLGQDPESEYLCRVRRARPTRRERRGRGAARRSQVRFTCADGLAPDGITSQCVPSSAPTEGRAPMGYARLRGAVQDGEANLYGSCQPAAPHGRQDHWMMGLHVRCGASGCTYVVPQGQAGCTSGSGCAVSCPSPRYRLANGPRGLSCTG